MNGVGIGPQVQDCDRYRGHLYRYALLADAGLIHQSKISSTPADPSVAVIEGVGQLLAELSISPRAIAEVLHGTTVGSNTILQRKGARTGLITTRGFRDVLEIGRIRMPDMFDLTWEKPKPLVPRRHRLEVAERIAADGGVVEPLDEAERGLGRRARWSPKVSRRSPSPSSTAIATRRTNSSVEAILRQHFPDLLVTASLPSCPSARNTSAPARRW